MGTEDDLHVALHQLESMLEEKDKVDGLWVLYEKQFSRDFAVQLGKKPVNNLIDLYHTDLFSAEMNHRLSESSIDLISNIFWRSFRKRHPDRSPQAEAAVFQELQARRCTPPAY